MIDRDPGHVWEEVARSFDAEAVVFPPTAWRAPQASFVANIEGVRVFVETVPLYDYVATYARAEAPAARGLRLAVFRGYVYPLGRAFGIQDVQIGDPVFDDRFIVKSNDEAYARAWLGPAAREHIRGADDFRYEVADERAVARRAGFESNAEALASATRAVAALALRGNDLLADWRRLAAHLGARPHAPGGAWRPDGSVWIEADHRGIEAVIDALVDDAGRGLHTRVRTRRPALQTDSYVIHRDGDRPLGTRRLGRLRLADPRFDGVFEVRCEEPARMGRRLTPELRAQLLQAAPREVRSDGEYVSVLLGGFEARPARIEQALEIATALGAEGLAPPSLGPYR